MVEKWGHNFPKYRVKHSAKNAGFPYITETQKPADAPRENKSTFFAFG
jgi:allophanate hydrolase subunit 1